MPSDPHQDNWSLEVFPFSVEGKDVHGVEFYATGEDIFSLTCHRGGEFLTLNKLYRQTNQVDEQFWRDLRVGYDRIAESTAPLVDIMLKRAIEDISNDELASIYGLFGMTFEEGSEHLSGLVTTLKPENKLLLILLREFQNRRKRFVEGYYLAVDLTDKSFTSPLGQVVSRQVV